jgi:predicted transcriptional regulator
MSTIFKSFLLGYGMPKLPSGKAQFSLYVDAELKKRFDDICETKGYKKQLHLERMLRAWIESEEVSTSESLPEKKPLRKGVRQIHARFVEPPETEQQAKRGNEGK